MVRIKMSQPENELILTQRDVALAYLEEQYLLMPVVTFVRMIEELGRDFPTILTLYLFYRMTARRQKTDKPWALDEHVRKSLGWSQDKLNKTKRLLVRHNFMEIVRGEKSHA